MYLYGWVTQAFHSMGILEYISKFYNQAYDLKYMTFYESFVEFSKTHEDSIFNQEYKTLVDYMDKGYSGGGWDHHDPDLASILWPIEEASWLRCVTDSSKLQSNIVKFIDYFEKKHGFDTPTDILTDLINFQVFLLMTMDVKDEIKSYESKYDWQDFLVNGVDDVSGLKEYNGTYFYENKIQEDDKEKWCFQAAWVGRSQGNYKCHPEFLYKNLSVLEENKNYLLEEMKKKENKKTPSSGV